jgi:two-component system response regulator TctD
MKVLIVEDDQMYRETLQQFLSGWGHGVRSADQGGQAIEMAAIEDFDLLLLDVYLPDMTARELIPALKVLQPRARIVTITGRNSRELERELREQGISYYMAKPVPMQELASILRHMGNGTRRKLESAAG